MMRYRKGVFLAGVMLGMTALPPAPALADDIRFDASLTQRCLGAGGGRSCIGQAAERCMEESPGGFSTYMSNMCLDAERAWWDGQLNARYRDLRAFEQQGDSEAARDPYAAPGRPSGADSLRDMQRAWIAFRDATCDYETVAWHGGTGASGVYLYCQMRMTGEQTIALSDYLGDQ